MADQEKQKARFLATRPTKRIAASVQFQNDLAAAADDPYWRQIPERERQALIRQYREELIDTQLRPLGTTPEQQAQLAMEFRQEFPTIFDSPAEPDIFGRTPESSDLDNPGRLLSQLADFIDPSAENAVVKGTEKYFTRRELEHLKATRGGTAGAIPRGFDIGAKGLAQAAFSAGETLGLVNPATSQGAQQLLGEDIARQRDVVRYSPAPQKAAQFIAEQLPSALAGGAAGQVVRGAGLLPTIGRGLVGGAAQGFTMPTEPGGPSRTLQTGLGAFTGAVAEPIAAGLNQLGQRQLTVGATRSAAEATPGRAALQAARVAAPYAPRGGLVPSSQELVESGLSSSAMFDSMVKPMEVAIEGITGPLPVGGMQNLSRAALELGVTPERTGISVVESPRLNRIMQRATSPQAPPMTLAETRTTISQLGDEYATATARGDRIKARAAATLKSALEADQDAHVQMLVQSGIPEGQFYADALQMAKTQYKRELQQETIFQAIRGSGSISRTIPGGRAVDANTAAQRLNALLEDPGIISDPVIRKRVSALSQVFKAAGLGVSSTVSPFLPVSPTARTVVGAIEKLTPNSTLTWKLLTNQEFAKFTDLINAASPGSTQGQRFILNAAQPVLSKLVSATATRAGAPRPPPKKRMFPQPGDRVAGSKQ